MTLDEFMRLLGSDEYYGVLVRLAALLLDGDTAAAGDVAREGASIMPHATSARARRREGRQEFVRIT